MDGMGWDGAAYSLCPAASNMLQAIFHHRSHVVNIDAVLVVAAAAAHIHSFNMKQSAAFVVLFSLLYSNKN